MDEHGWKKDENMMEQIVCAPSTLCFSAVSWMDIRALSAVVITEEVENSWPGSESVKLRFSTMQHRSVETQSPALAQGRVEFKINTYLF